MKNPLKTASSSSSFVWIVLLIVILASFVFVTILTNTKSETIKSNIRALHEENNNYQRIDTCISLLYAAENNSRLYVITLDSSYLRNYGQQIRTVSLILANFEDKRQKKRTSLSNLVATKKVKDAEFVDLKVMLDSLLTFSEIKASLKTPAIIKPKTVITKTTSVAKTDSILVVNKKSKKKLFKRIVDAISNKDEEQKALTLSGSSSVSRDSVVSAVPFGDSGFSNVYDQLDLAMHKLNESEHQLLIINGRIFSNLQASLKFLKREEEARNKALRDSLLQSTYTKFEDVSKLSSWSVLIVIVLAVMIFWNLYKLYKNEKVILEYARITNETTRRKGNFMAQMTHEIRTPLNSIIGFSQLIETEKLDKELRENVDAIKSSSKILLTLVNEILDFSKFESGKITLQNRPFYPFELINDAVVLLSVQAAAKNISVSCQSDLDRKVSLSGDELRIKQIVINLITNAVKFTGEGGSIKVRFGFEKNVNEKGYLNINVQDSGVGIAPENLKMIFEDFIQLEDSGSNARLPGTGLGLAISKRIVDLYGGKIKVESVVGSGSEFMVSIPLEVAKPPVMIVPALKKVLTLEALSGKRLLIADDTRMNLILISLIMDKHGVAYDLASDGAEAFELFKKNRYDLVITDIHMPNMDGVELTKRIRGYSDENKSEIPILGFTGSSTEENKLHYAEIGINDVLEKPFEERNMLQILNNLLQVEEDKI